MGLQTIKDLRNDITDYVLHSARNKKWQPRNRDETFEVLKSILSDGFFKVGKGEVPVRSSDRIVETIRDPRGAVCFTEQPLTFFAQSIEANHRYTEFCITVRKDELFAYGGRPVIYGDKNTLELLPDDLKYLYVNYDPRAGIDWTHEREWRVRANVSINRQVGVHGLPDEVHRLVYESKGIEEVSKAYDGYVPVHLPKHYVSRTPNEPHFFIFVDTRDRKKELIEWVDANSEKIGKKGEYWQKYADALKLVSITQTLSFEEVQEKGIGRIEDFLNG